MATEKKQYIPPTQRAITKAANEMEARTKALLAAHRTEIGNMVRNMLNPVHEQLSVFIAKKPEDKGVPVGGALLIGGLMVLVGLMIGLAIGGF